MPAGGIGTRNRPRSIAQHWNHRNSEDLALRPNSMCKVKLYVTLMSTVVSSVLDRKYDPMEYCHNEWNDVSEPYPIYEIPLELT